MRKLVIFLALLGLLIGLKGIYDNFLAPDALVIRSIPEYPNSINWQVRSGGSFPDDPHYIAVDFATTDAPEKVIDYYQDFLKKDHWLLVNSVEPGNDYSEARPISQIYSRGNNKLSILIKPSLGNVTTSLTDTNPQKLNQVSFSTY